MGIEQRPARRSDLDQHVSSTEDPHSLASYLKTEGSAPGLRLVVTNGDDPGGDDLEYLWLDLTGQS